MSASVQPTHKRVFFLYGTTPKASRALREAFQIVAATHPNTHSYDVSGLSYVNIRELHQQSERHGFKPTIYLKEGLLPRVISETWVTQQTTVGLIRHGLARDVISIGSQTVLEMVTHASLVIEAEQQGAQKNTEVNQLKNRFKQEDLLTKQRQNQQEFDAKKRELDQDARDSQQKILAPKKPKADGV